MWPAGRVSRSLKFFSRKSCRFVIIEILLHAYFKYFSDIVDKHIFSNKHCCIAMDKNTFIENPKQLLHVHYTIKVQSVCSTGAIQYAQAYAQFC